MIFTKEIRKLPFSKICPYNENDLVVFLDPCTALIISNIQDAKDSIFSIKDIMENNIEVFGNQGFEERCKEFSKILSTRIERFFTTKKTHYMFFDKEEQMALEKAFNQFELFGIVKIFLRKDEESSFEEKDFDHLTNKEFMRVKKYIENFGIRYMIAPRRFYNINLKATMKSQESMKDIRFKIRRSLMLFCHNKKKIMQILMSVRIIVFKNFRYLMEIVIL
jgi:hypothetical protein